MVFCIWAFFRRREKTIFSLVIITCVVALRASALNVWRNKFDVRFQSITFFSCFEHRKRQWVTNVSMHLSQIHDELGTWCKVKRNERNFRFTAIKKSKRGENRLISLYFNCFFFRSICVINCGGERPLKMRTPRQIFEINLILICALIRHFGQQVAFSASFLGPSVWPRMWCERVTEMFALANERLWSKFHADHSVTQNVDSIGSWTKRLAILIQRGQRLTTWVSANTFWLVSNGKCLATTIYGTAFDFKAAQANNNNQTADWNLFEIQFRSQYYRVWNRC